MPPTRSAHISTYKDAKQGMWMWLEVESRDYKWILGVAGRNIWYGLGGGGLDQGTMGSSVGQCATPPQYVLFMSVSYLGKVIVLIVCGLFSLISIITLLII